VITNATIDEETLKATNTGVDEALQVGIVAGDDAAVEADIDPALAGGSRDLLIQVGHGGGGRDSVKRHVNDGSDTAKGRGLGAGIEALPFSTAGLIQVNVSIDQAGQ